jgi:hypothetical protein
MRLRAPLILALFKIKKIIKLHQPDMVIAREKNRAGFGCHQIQSLLAP